MCVCVVGRGGQEGEGKRMGRRLECRGEGRVKADVGLSRTSDPPCLRVPSRVPSPTPLCHEVPGAGGKGDGPRRWTVSAPKALDSTGVC